MGVWQSWSLAEVHFGRNAAPKLGRVGVQRSWSVPESKFVANCKGAWRPKSKPELQCASERSKLRVCLSASYTPHRSASLDTAVPHLHQEHATWF